MAVSPCPDFYDSARNIRLDSLTKLMDRDSYRFHYEGPQQASFLQRCDNLKFLELFVCHPNSFSWALERNPVKGTQRHPQHFLCNMDWLVLSMDASLTVVNDALVAFGQNLLSFHATSHVSFNGVPLETLPNP